MILAYSKAGHVSQEIETILVLMSLEKHQYQRLICILAHKI